MRILGASIKRRIYGNTVQDSILCTRKNTVLNVRTVIPERQDERSREVKILVGSSRTHQLRP